MSYGDPNSFGGSGGGFPSTPSLGGLSAILQGLYGGYTQGQSAVYQRAMAQAQLMREQNIANSQMQYRQDRIAESDQARQLAAQKWAADPSNPSGSNYTDPQDANDRALATSALAPVLDSLNKGAPPEARAAIASSQRALLVKNPGALAYFDAATGGGPAGGAMSSNPTPPLSGSAGSYQPASSLPPTTPMPIWPTGTDSSAGTQLTNNPPPVSGSAPPAAGRLLPTPPPINLPPWVTASLGNQQATPNPTPVSKTQAFAPTFKPVPIPTLPVNNIGANLPTSTPPQTPPPGSPPPAIPIPGSQTSPVASATSDAGNNANSLPLSASSNPTPGSMPATTPGAPPPSPNILNLQIPPKPLTPVEKSEMESRGISQLLGMSDASKTAAINSPAWRAANGFADTDVPMLSNLSKAPSGAGVQPATIRSQYLTRTMNPNYANQPAAVQIADRATTAKQLADAGDTDPLLGPGYVDPTSGKTMPAITPTGPTPDQQARTDRLNSEVSELQKALLDPHTTPTGRQNIVARLGQIKTLTGIGIGSVLGPNDVTSITPSEAASESNAQQNTALHAQSVALESARAKAQQALDAGKVPQSVELKFRGLLNTVTQAQDDVRQADQLKTAEINKGTAANPNVISSENARIIQRQADAANAKAAMEQLVPGSTGMSNPTPQRGTTPPGSYMRNPVTKQPVAGTVKTSTGRTFIIVHPGQ